VRSLVHLVCISGIRNAYRSLAGKDNIQLGNKHLCQNSVKVEVREIEKLKRFYSCDWQDHGILECFAL
jgi:hypothetical protein